MQSKISSFFKPSPSSSSSSSAKPCGSIRVCDDEEDELAIWEKAEHNFVNTYRRRSKRIDGVEAIKESMRNAFKDTILENEHLRAKSASTGRILNKKRSYAQFHLELGQSDFLLHTCSTCGVKYAPGDEGDEKNHNTFHKNYTHGVPFKGWRNERVIDMPGLEGGRVVLVLDGDHASQRNKVQEVVNMMEIDLGEGWILYNHWKVYLFITLQRVAGCLVAEPIKEAFKVLSCSVGERCDSTLAMRTIRSNSTTLQFGEIALHREVIKKFPSVKCSEGLANHNGAVFCEEESVAAVCGIRAIWVTPANRRNGIATHLLEAVRKSFCKGFVLEKLQLAFSQPSSSGNVLASSYVGSRSFLVYKTDQLGS